MNCSKVKKHLEDYVLRELDPGVEIQINTHLLACVACRRRVDEAEQIRSIFSGTTRFEPPNQVYFKVRGQVRKLSRQDKGILAKWKLSIAYGLAFLVGMVIMRVIDVRTIKAGPETKLEVQYEPKFRKPLSDTVFFSPAPPKNLART